MASRNVPPWLATRNPADLPDGFVTLATEDAIASIRGTEALLHPQTGNNGKLADNPGHPPQSEGETS
jgi:hypothetical protein